MELKDSDISLVIRHWDILMCLGQLFLSPPRVLSPVYLANSSETIPCWLGIFHHFTQLSLTSRQHFIIIHSMNWTHGWPLQTFLFQYVCLLSEPYFFLFSKFSLFQALLLICCLFSALPQFKSAVVIRVKFLLWTKPVNFVCKVCM